MYSKHVMRLMLLAAGIAASFFLMAIAMPEIIIETVLVGMCISLIVVTIGLYNAFWRFREIEEKYQRFRIIWIVGVDKAVATIAWQELLRQYPLSVKQSEEQIHDGYKIIAEVPGDFNVLADYLLVLHHDRGVKFYFDGKRPEEQPIQTPSKLSMKLERYKRAFEESKKRVKKR